MRKILSFLTAILFAGSMMATLPENPQWEAKALADIADGSTLIIISNSTTATNVALPSTATNSNPAKKICEVTTAGGVTTITAPEGSSLQDLAWTLVKSGDNYKFYQEGSEEIRMYLTGLSTNTGLRIGNANSANDEFVMGDLGQLLKVTTGTRFVGPYDNNGSDWRTYNTENATNYKGAELTFYVLKASQGGEEPVVEPTTKTIYLNGGGASLWNQADPEFFVHSWGGAADGDAHMTLVEGDVYKADIPADNTDLLFLRLATGTTEIVWSGDAHWNQSANQTIPEGKDLFTMTSWDNGEWSVYGEEPVVVEPTLANGFYLIGKINGVEGWNAADLAADRKFEGNPENNAEFVLTATLAEGDEIKVVNVLNDAITAWYPAEGGNYTIDAAHAGEKDIYFRPDLQGGEDWFGACIYIAANEEPQPAEVDFTKPFTLLFNGTNGSGDNSSTFKVSDGVAAIFDAASAPYVSELTSVDNVYAGRIIAEEPSSLKFGTSSKKGTLAFTLGQEIEVDSIIVNATQYGNDAAEVTVNGVMFELTQGNKVPTDCKLIPEDKVSAITIAQTGSQRIYLRYVKVYPKQAGEEPVVEPAKFYITGDSAFVVNAGLDKEQAWNPAAIKSTETSYKLNLAAGDYKLKVTVDGTWSDGMVKGFDALTTIANGLTSDADGNICFTLTEAGEVNVHYDGEYFFLNGNFYVAPVVAHYYLKNNWDGGEWTWKELVYNAENEDYELQAVFGGTGVDFNTAESDEGADHKWIAVEEIETYGEALGALDTVLFFFDPELVDQYTPGANGLYAVITGKYVAPVEPEDKLPVVGLGANFNGWNWAENLLVNAEDSLSASIKVNLGVTDSIQFKIVSDGSWLSLNGEGETLYKLHRDWNKAEHVNLVNDGRNFSLETDVEGEYTFTWTYADSTLVVTFPEKPVEPVVGDGPIFEWTKGAGAAIAADNTDLNANDLGTMTVGKSVVARLLGTNAVENNAKGYKLGNNDVCVEIEGTRAFAAGDTVVITGVCGGSGERAFAVAPVSTIDAKADTVLTNYQENTSDVLEYKAVLKEQQAGDKIRIFRLAGKTMYLYSIKVLPGEAPAEEPAKFYITGDAALVGEELAWNPAAIKSTETSYKLNLAAGDYKLKVTVDGTWNDGMVKGYDALTTIANGLTADEDGNICFTLTEAGEVNVHYDGEYFFLNGNFYVAPVVAHYYLKNNWDGGEWTWKELVYNAENEDYELQAVFGGTGVDFNTVESNEGADYKWIAVEEIETYGEALGALDTVLFFFDPELVDQYTPGANGLYAVITGKYVAPVEEGCNWENIEFLGGPAENANQFKVCKPENVNVVNIQNPNWSEKTQMGIYMIFPSAAFGEISLDEALYEKQGAGILFFLSAFTAQETEFVVNCDGNDLVITVYNANGGTPQPAHTYTVAGSSDVAFGTAWDPTNTANDMEMSDDGIYVWEKTELTLAAGSIGFKVCEDHAWDVAYPASDYQLVIPEAGIYTIWIHFDPANGNAVTAEATKTGSAVVLPTIAMHGNFLGSWADTENFTVAEGDATASLTLDLAAGNYEFGMRIGGSGNWTANGVSFTRENASAEVVAGSGNLKLVADVEGEYTFTWTFATNSLAITFPEGGVIPEPTLANGYYLIGKLEGVEGWNVESLSADRLFSANETNEGEYVLNATLAEGDAFKVVYVYNDAILTWFPEGDNYVVDQNHAGTTDIYFRPDYQGGEDWYAHCIFVTPTGTTGIDPVEVDPNAPALKVLRNGQIFIIKGGKAYNVMGAAVR